ncbi:uncharacterized protein LOC128398109 [Panonychus citri]|uniref:uncharacterized protein LOC128385996 n=1 Tax=Panonychus citri TaxID=50023 RepID=UPI0023074341|nr:uncharacterized protein LOC128385996 [Panonychus citri]XP_053214897.1 uncharacterized protein LOC128398109 [Panonychus citri]
MSVTKFTCVLLAFVVGVSFGDPHRPGKYLDHDRTVVNCAKYKREANQHSCVLSAFNTEGPYFLPDDLERSDIVDDQIGVPLDLKINLVNSNDCTPLENMYVHIWHTNAKGSYSGVENAGQDGTGFPDLPDFPGFGGPGGPFGPNGPQGPPPGMEDAGPGNSGMGNFGRPTPTTNERFCRGYQVTDSNGQVNFKTIIPGWYFGRCLHIHVEVFAKNTTEINEISYVGQIFFDQQLPYQLKLIEPYSQNNQQLLLNDNDHIYLNHGNETLIELDSKGSGFSSSITLGLNPEAK